MEETLKILNDGKKILEDERKEIQRRINNKYEEAKLLEDVPKDKLDLEIRELEREKLKKNIALQNIELQKLYTVSRRNKDLGINQTKIDFEKFPKDKNKIISTAKRHIAVAEFEGYISKDEIKTYTELIEIKTANRRNLTPNENENIDLKSEVFNKLKEKEIKKKVLQKLPKLQQKENRKWTLTTGQVYNKYFANSFPDDKGTIIRYIKTFRSQNTKKV